MLILTKEKDFSYYFPYTLKQHNCLLYIGEIDSNDKILLSDGVNAYRHKTYLNKKGLYFVYKGKRFYVTLYDEYNRLINFIGLPIYWNWIHQRSWRINEINDYVIVILYQLYCWYNGNEYEINLYHKSYA